MNRRQLLLRGLLSPLLVLLVAAPSFAVVFVDSARPDDTGNGLTWATAKKTIKAGVTAAAGQPDLTVWVAKGTYTEAAGIVLTSGIQVYGGLNVGDVPPFDLNTRTFVPPTVVQPTGGTQANSIFVAQGNNVIDGFTIQGGAAAVGAAIQCLNNANCTVTNCIVQNNTSATAGAGVYALSGGTGVTLRVDSCKFKSNQAGNGGAIYADGPSVLVSNSVFETNSAHFGGGICILNGLLTVNAWSVFTGNSAKDVAAGINSGGGAIYALKTSVYVSRSTFGSNTAQINLVNGGSATGGAISAFDGSLLRVEGCSFNTCLATGSAVATRFALGGAVYVKGMLATFRSNIFAKCAAIGAGDIRPAYGGAIYFANPGIPDIRNNTFYDNFVTPQAGLVGDADRPYGLGAAIFLSGSTSGSIINNIITHSRGTAVVNEGMNITFNYNLLWHNAGGDTYGITYPVYSTNPLLNKDFNIMKDPQFRHAPSLDLHITYGSPARDAGYNSGAPATDIDGEPRPYYSGVQLPAPLVPIVDIGADEFVDTRNPKVGGADNDPRNPPGGDADGDLIHDAFDNCNSVANVHQVDSNGDGIGDVCPNSAPLAYFVDNSLPAPPAWPTAPQPDGLTWATAFRTIQQAIDAADLHNRDLSDLPGPPAKPWWTKNAEVWVRGGGVPGGQMYTENIALWHGVAAYGAWKGPNPPTKPLGELPTDVPDPHPFRDLNADLTSINGNFVGSSAIIAHLPQVRYLSNPNDPAYDASLKSRYEHTITVLDSFVPINGRNELGGGVSIYKDLANVSTCRMQNNTAALGGGVYMYNTNSMLGDGLAPPPATLLSGSTYVFANAATGPPSYAGYGGGVYTERGSPTIFANLIEGNTAFFGGGIASRRSAPMIIENLIGCELAGRPNLATGVPAGNNGKGGGVYMDSDSGVVTNKNTIVSNAAQGASAQGGGIWSFDSNLYMKNTIVANNASGGTGASIWAGETLAGTYPWLTCPWCYITYSDFFNNLPAPTAFVGIPDPTTPPIPACAVCPDTNLALNPQFVNPAACGYSLAVGSPLRGAGDPTDGPPTPNIGAFQDEDPPVSIAAAKSMANGVVVEITGSVVTAVFDDGFYVEEADRTSGIKVRVSNPPLQVGQVVRVNGIISTYGLEREIMNPSLTLLFPESRPVVKPLAMANRRLGGTPVGPYVQNPLGGTGLCNLGLLVTTWGRVTEIIGGSSPGFAIDDGSGVGVKVLPAVGLSAPTVGVFVTVTGISSAVADESGKWTRAIRPRGSSDVIYPPR